MKRKETIFVTVGVLLILAVSGGIYLSYQLDRVVTSLSKPGILFSDVDTSPVTDGIETESAADGTDTYQEGSSYQTTGRTHGSTGSSGTVDAGAHGVIANGVQQKVGRPIENKDMIKAGLIILQRLDSDEISYLFRVGSQDQYTKEDMQQVQKILKSKLTEEDIAVLKVLGDKYGKELRVLDDEEIK